MSRTTISLALVLILPAPAQAGTIELRQGATEDSANFYVFTAAPGERNDIVVEELPGGFRLRDAASPPAGCVPEGPDAVRCARATREISLTIDAGDGDDRVTADGSVGSVLGGPGDDSLGGEGGRDRYAGGTGDDRIFVEFAREATIGCGSGTDRIFVAQRNGARLDADCERVQGVGPLIAVRRDAGGRLRGLDLRWHEREFRTPCRVRVTFTDGGRTLGRVDLRSVSQRRTRIARLARHAPGRMVRVTLRASDRCAGRFGRGYTPTAFQVAS